MNLTFFKLLTRVVFPLGGAGIGIVVWVHMASKGFDRLTAAEAIDAAIGGMTLFGSAAAIAVWKFESELLDSIRSQERQQVLNEMDWLLGTESLEDEQRASIVLARRFLVEVAPGRYRG